MTFNTGNNVPSTDPRDLYDNAENLDKLVNGENPFYADRLGKLRESWAGMENTFATSQAGRENAFALSQADKESRFQAFLVSSGYVSRGDYAANVVLEERNEYVAVDAATTGTTAGLYRPGPGATLPLTLTGTWATDSANLVLLGDDVLRQELAGQHGSAMIGNSAVIVKSISDLIALQDSARRDDLRYFVEGYHSGSSLGGGEFVWIASSVAAHNGGSVIRPTVPAIASQSGADLSQQLANYIAGTGDASPSTPGAFVAIGAMSLARFGAASTLTDNYAPIQAALDYSRGNAGEWYSAGNGVDGTGIWPISDGRPLYIRTGTSLTAKTKNGCVLSFNGYGTGKPCMVFQGEGANNYCNALELTDIAVVSDSYQSIGWHIPADTYVFRSRISAFFEGHRTGFLNDGNFFSLELGHMIFNRCFKAWKKGAAGFQTSFGGDIGMQACFHGLDWEACTYLSPKIFVDQCGTWPAAWGGAAPADEIPVLLKFRTCRGMNFPYVGYEQNVGIHCQVDTYSRVEMNAFVFRKPTNPPLVTVPDATNVPLARQSLWSVGAGSAIVLKNLEHIERLSNEFSALSFPYVSFTAHQDAPALIFDSCYIDAEIYSSSSGEQYITETGCRNFSIPGIKTSAGNRLAVQDWRAQKVSFFDADAVATCEVSAAGPNLALGSKSSTNKLLVAAAVVQPNADNVMALGSAGLRFSQVFAASGTISTSDADLKSDWTTEVAPELRAWGKVQFGKYRFKDAVTKKGEAARWHFGVLAQNVKAAFESEGLDPFAYGLLCYDEWEAIPEITDDAGNVVQPAREAGSRYGIRYEEALALECAYLRSRLAG